MDLKLSISILLLLFTFALSSSSSDDSKLLLAFKSSLPNPSVLSSWDQHRLPCFFDGVTCRGSAVTAVSLFGLQLGAAVSSVFATLLVLENLESLSLKFGNLTGSLASVSRCSPRLASLDLAGNGIAGFVDDVALLVKSCASLRSLNLSGNAVGGCKLTAAAGGIWLESLDLSFNKISSRDDVSFILSGFELKYVNLAGNEIPGEIPAIGNCSALEFLDLSSNELYGVIGDGYFSGCTELRFLNLSSNNFAGNLPKDVSILDSLEVINLSSNNFSGEIADNFFSSLLNLKKIELSFNNLNGELPDSISKLAKLEMLDLSSNGLSGSIPSSLCLHSSLQELYLQSNFFTRSIPETLSNCSMLISLDLSFNYLKGTIPFSLGSLSQLKDLILWQNRLEGEIPNELGLVSSLENLILDDNALAGSIPEGLSNCTNLNWVSLSSNRFSGEIPLWLGKLEKLAILKLSNNSFSGEIPKELGDCKSLIWLDLNSNNLSGMIPDALVKQSGNIAVGLVTGKRYVYLKNDGSKECHGAGNLLEFAGIRPEKLSQMPTWRSCNFTRVYMGSTQYTFNNNGSMIFLDLSYNQLGGNIPKEIGNMYYLMVLNLGHNLLSGPIPFELGNLHSVGVLDLSHNSLVGQIPGSFSSLTLLSEIDLSYNRLNGSIPELGQLATFPSYRYENNSGLCGFPLPPCGKGPISVLNSDHHISRRRQASIIASIAMGLLFIVLCIVGVIMFVIENKKREMKSNTGHNNLGGTYIDSRSHSGTANSNWKLTSTKEALSISLATFDQKPLRKLTFADLLEATNGFQDDSLIGSGGFGDVYKAQLKDGSVVAIKKLIRISSQGDREFMAEMETVGKVKHHNLVPLLGYCKVGEERLLVYEYMKYGSLEDVLHDRKKAGIKLNWAARRNIAVGAARGLAFLHHNCIPHIIHRDMKSSNVLLDENLEARVSDFGMARMMSVMDTHLSVSTLAGTPGYVPPEYYQCFRCTTKGDVYSYGVVLLELLTGKKPTDSSDFGDSNLVGWVKERSKFRISDVFDPVLVKEDTSLELELLEHLKIACACLDDRPMRRPTMVKVMTMFKEILTGSTVDSAASDVVVSVVDGSFNAADMSLKEGKEDRD